jgi:hypothetical protein
VTEADDARWWSELLDGRDDSALQLPDTVWNSALTAAVGASQRPEIDDLIPDDDSAPLVAAAAPWAGAPEADWPDDEDVADLEPGLHFAAADEAPFDDDDLRQHRRSDG